MYRAFRWSAPSWQCSVLCSGLAQWAAGSSGSLASGLTREVLCGFCFARGETVHFGIDEASIAQPVTAANAGRVSCLQSDAVGPARLRSALSVAAMRKDESKFLKVCRRALACLWAAVGLWAAFVALRTFASLNLSNIIALTVGLAFVIGASGLFFNKRWGRIFTGCLMVLVILWSADMLLFIAFRGLDAGRRSLLGVAAGLVLSCICTWSVLLATRRRHQLQ